MRRIMCVHLSQWPIDRWKRRHGGFAPRPIVLVETVASRQVVAVASIEAQQHGARAGMSLAEARALCAGLVHAPHTPDRDARALEALARWMMRFSPVVGMVERGMDRPPHVLSGVFLDLTGCERVFGGLTSLVEQVDEAMRRLGLSARVAVAPTIGAAWALAFAGRENGRIVTGSAIAEALAPLPPIALRIDEQTAQALHHLGIERIGQLMALAREALPARFGTELLTRLDQALGRIPEPLTGLVFQAPIEAGMEFDGVVDSLEAIWRVFKDLIGQVVGELARRGCGARRLRARFRRADAPPIDRQILLSRPSRDPANLFNLVRCAMEGMEEEARRDEGAKGRRGRSALAHAADRCDSNVPTGFTGIHLAVAAFERISDQQVSLLEREQHDGQVELDHLIERLMIRLGEQALARVRLVESYVPERACGEGASGKGLGVSTDRAACPLPLAPCPSPVPRPMHLFPRPAEIGVMVCPSHDDDGRPVSFTWEGRVHRLTHAVGPERIAGWWWEGHRRTRDYFAVEDEAGRRWWLFRVRETGRWYVHGGFE